VTDRASEMYARELGDDALSRQKQERVDRHPCCGERADVGHHVMCSKRPADEPAAHVDGQGSLL
jgi:hypothetical protein